MSDPILKSLLAIVALIAASYLCLVALPRCGRERSTRIPDIVATSSTSTTAFPRLRPPVQ